MQQAGRKWKLRLPDFVCMVILLVFIGLKLPHMSLPYHWDELGVYAPGALYMFDHGPGLLPAALDPEFSHGHPLFFYFLNGWAFRLFGTSTWVGHLVPLLLALLTLFAIYKLVAKMATPWLGLLAMTMLAVQPLFFAQSIMMLPEIALLLWMFLALSAWMNQHYIWYAWWSALAILTKETAVILPLTVLLYEAILYIRHRKISWSMKWIWAFSSWIVFGIFLLVQKVQNGWFFFPYHIDLVKTDFHSLQINLKAYVLFLFVQQGRWLLSILILGALGWLVYRRRNFVTQPIPAMVIALLFMGMLFCTLNFYMSRYTAFMLPWLVIALMYALHETGKIWLHLAVSISLMVISIRYMDSGRFAVDTDMSYVPYVEKKQEALKYIERHFDPGQRIFSNFPFYYSFTIPRAGYDIGSFPPDIPTEVPVNGDWLLKATNGPDKPVFQYFDQVAPDTVIQVFPNAQFLIGRLVM